MKVTASLQDWADIRDPFGSGGILIGNGASIAVWPEFKYKSLFEKAQSKELDAPLTDADKTIFEIFDTDIFEEVLNRIGTAILIARALKQDAQALQDRYDSIRSGLVQAVAKVHIEPAWVRADVLDTTADVLRHYSYVYSTNYDLLIYWAMARLGFADNFVDFFWNTGRSFDPANVVPRLPGTRVLWLHGALHLVQHADGRATKSKKSLKTLLEKFAADYGAGARPLFVSEGSSTDKMATIRASHYLHFAYSCLAEHVGNLVVFGHRLASQDRHIADAVRTNAGMENIAVGIHRTSRTTNAAVIRQKLRYEKVLGRNDLVFYESGTHPLGSSDMRCYSI